MDQRTTQAGPFQILSWSFLFLLVVPPLLLTGCSDSASPTEPSGDGASNVPSLPVPVAGGELFTSVGSGVVHSCGVTMDARLLCWGLNWTGQLGDGSTSGSSTPVAVAAP